MRHSVEFQPPIIPFERAPAHVRKRFGLSRSVTKDACACRTRDDSAAAITIVMAIRHLESQLQALAAQLGIGDMAGNLDQQLTEAEQRLADARKETRIAKIERVLNQHEADKAGDNQQNEPANEPRNNPLRIHGLQMG
jgi:hypothetical protein